MMQWNAKPFEALSTAELHDLLKLRSDVFVVEQQCVYPDLDGRDKGALHLLGHLQNGELAAYARILPPTEDTPPRIGRVLVSLAARGTGVGHEIMRSALTTLITVYGNSHSMLSAQSHLEAFYCAHGFVRSGPDYDLDGIPHVDMTHQESP